VREQVDVDGRRAARPRHRCPDRASPARLHPSRRGSPDADPGFVSDRGKGGAGRSAARPPVGAGRPHRGPLAQAGGAALPGGAFSSPRGVDPGRSETPLWISTAHRSTGRRSNRPLRRRLSLGRHLRSAAELGRPRVSRLSVASAERKRRSDTDLPSSSVVPIPRYLVVLVALPAKIRARWRDRCRGRSRKAEEVPQLSPRERSSSGPREQVLTATRRRTGPKGSGDERRAGLGG
jgi:hypothetical protein